MSSANVRRDAHPGRMTRTLYAREGAVAEDMYRKALRVQAAARGFVGNRTGHLRSRIEVRPYRAANGGWGMHVGVWTVRYARWHHDGNYHTQGAYIRPTRKKALRFVVGGRVVFAAKVRSYRGSKYLTRAVPFARDG